ncbi:MAG: hypothetical protein U9N76_07075, partial [Candidatus Marinimicrobia bacterium]|nr:hypothetical protein [Candidatus Neomarinimicrobiota bacterium]
NISLNYEIFNIGKKRLDKFMNSEAQKLDGFNITIPYKEKVIPYLEKIDSTAKKIGAINTIKVIDGKFYAFNTDILGFMKTVQSQIPEYKKYFPVLIGYGGVSKAVIFGLEELGFEKCSVTGGLLEKDRTQMKKEVSPLLKMKIVKEIPSDKNILWINATPIGTAKFPKIPNHFIDIKSNDFLFDLNYSPNPTYLQKWFNGLYRKVTETQRNDNKIKSINGLYRKVAETQRNDNKIKSINGIYMLIYQGIASEEIWFPEINFVNLDVGKIVDKII